MTYYGPPATPIVGIVFGSILLAMAMTYAFYLVKVHLDHKWVGSPCNGNCQCRGTRKDDEASADLPPYNRNNAEGREEEVIRLLDADPPSRK